MQLKRGLNVAITRNALTQNLATRGRKCDDTHQYCSNTNGCFYPRKPVASKQPTCVESKREVNKVNGKLTETVEDWRRDGWHHTTHHTPPFHSRHTTTTSPHLLVEGGASSSSGQSSQWGQTNRYSKAYESASVPSSTTGTSAITKSAFARSASLARRVMRGQMRVSAIAYS